MATTRDNGRTTIRWIQWSLVLALVALALTTVGGEPATAAPIEQISRDQLRSDCALAGGRFIEKADGGYACWISGLLVDCDAGGRCESWCYAAHGCRCDLLVNANCLEPFIVNESSDPLDETVQIDPYQEAQLPDQSGSGGSSQGTITAPGTVIVAADQVMKGTGPSSDTGEGDPAG